MASLLLRVGLAIGFLYPAIAGLIEPQNWIGFLPGPLATMEALVAFEIAEILLALWLLSGYRARYAALVSGIAIAGVIVANITLLDILFRDIPMLFAAAALYVISKSPRV